MVFKEKSSLFLVLFYSIVLLLFSIVIAQNLFNNEDEDIISGIIEEEIQLNQFGFNDFELVETIKNVQRNETLSDIFNSYNLGSVSLENIILKAQDIFNVRSIRAGRPYHSYVSDDSLSQLRY
jgi:ABC-type bacteriocin/lantibiotic exporter with double-glycine peptidase domain